MWIEHVYDGGGLHRPRDRTRRPRSPRGGVVLQHHKVSLLKATPRHVQVVG
ncbi:hypothetical protein KBX53_23310 [Micromonospora sp. M51]|uniref:hypothetical protein n=1 Tax=Micromonospora sp. M51 TaxID=2824889 RepID=UPI001B392F0D|nr:hypothetical protein [Micromonospora sp. M51]MBQ1013821.1 hypothetical protein [Micromonospora sp. M51]